MQETQEGGSIPGQKDTLEQEIATHSSILTWKISWTEEPDSSPYGRKESDTTEHTHIYLIGIGK